MGGVLLAVTLAGWQALTCGSATLVDDNLVIALRPDPGYAAPFSATRVLDQKWYRAGRPYDDCPACNAA